jgi:molybdenum cofactor cytidylyltransferase
VSEIFAIVLAAGESKRMCFPKMLLSFDGKTMIEKVIENISQSKIDRTMVVTGAYREEICKVLQGRSVIFCHNENYRDGMLSSVKCAFRSIPEEASRVLVFPGDKPYITADVINLLVDSSEKTSKGIILPVYMKKRGHPVLIDLSYRQVVDELNPEEGLRSLSRLYPDDVLEVQTDTPGILKDIDTYQDYLSILNQLP